MNKLGETTKWGKRKRQEKKGNTIFDLKHENSGNQNAATKKEIWRIAAKGVFTFGTGFGTIFFELIISIL